ncbi:Stk1 family PASTA domain-containing Ser/Thr kinase [Bacillus licheniformis]|uniref:Serine/threonine-protein kinase PrkC n=3 Tax=Bacillus TaxID=1386 RepID=Q65JS1_BACLD|nr:MULTISPECIES: Stk1 family PASTA domain-containing Ser/Thr kinase [Bacillus]MBJ7887325.1 Stk1 family PASTA domain-containing Ser/Thr kinase [Bacillaceae bacterium HSR45]MDP4079080.1 Stk1 family PASTA domain-containing Ser/Thr kinase [Bacillota bacterium]NBB42651.1 Stk1 family PASTA domain-containing Ser/Thr kinase [Bacillus sp. y1(2019)]AAU23333.1 protein kinase PrkC [Bacillus licheniformis DSM 13 = ATCC 14580]AAU40693.1 serine/threonine-protein kinase PrkC [Bacillus licheniformis DSM 13 = A
MLIGRRISGRYEILRAIGGGGMANVYLALDIILDREVAIKVLRFDFVHDADFIRRFRREAQSAASLDHPNIVSIYDVGEEDDIYYIVMEYVEGMTLKEYINRTGPLHPKEAVQIMEQIVSAIAHAHDNQIVHRDIKPHNILIDHMGHIKVTDFGIAMALSSTTITHTNSVLGSVHYLSPEQARGGLSTKKSDIYSLGIVLFELLTARMPFEGESAVSIALKHLQSETPSVKRWNPAVPQSIENVVLKAMAKDPFHRYEAAEEMENDLKTAFDPDRLNEKRFTIPSDDEMTKAVPIIKNLPENGSSSQSGGGEEEAAPLSKKEKKKQAKANKKKKRKKWPLILLTVFFVLAASAVLALTVFPSLFIPKDVAVPDVAGLEYEEAVIKLEDEGFEVDPNAEDIADDKIEEGLIVKTDPAAGDIVKEGSTVKLYKSSGKEKTEVDDVVGQKVDAAKKLLEQKGFKNIKTEEVHDEEEAGTIIEQDPAAGTEIVAADDEVKLTVSLGPEAITLRDLKTYSKQAASGYLDDHQLVLVEKEAHSEDVPEGQVIKQKPEAGASVKPGDKVEVTFSLGPKQKPVKTVTEKIDIPYEPGAAGEEQNVQISIDDEEHSISDVYENFKITAPAERTIKFRIAPGQKGYYQVTINDKVVRSKTIEYPEDE